MSGQEGLGTELLRGGVTPIGAADCVVIRSGNESNRRRLWTAPWVALLLAILGLGVTVSF